MPLLTKIASLTLFSVLLFSARTLADTITGTVVDSNGVPVAGVNIDAIRRSNGNNINLSNDGTNGAGVFNTTIPADVYDLWFIPPAPPANSHVTLVLRNVVVVGTKNLGTLHLQAGSVVSGHVQNQAGQPVSQVDLKMIDNLTGFEVPLANRRPDAFGNFQVAAPKNQIELDFDATSVTVQVLASKAFTLTPTVNTGMGTIVLQPGFHVTGHVQRSSNAVAVASVDLDFKDTATGVTLYTPNDNSDSLGNFSVVVPAGNYDVDFEAPLSTRLAGRRVNRTVSPDQSLGTVLLDAGAVLSGTIRSFDNVLQVDADVDVYIQSTGELIPTGNDNTNASGVYSVIAPLGNLRVEFRPPNYTVPLVSDVEPNILVSADRTLNGVLPAWPAPNNYGAGLAGTGGVVPHIAVSGGTARSGNSNFSFNMTGGRGGALGVLQVSVLQASLPFKGGTLLLNPNPSCSVKTVIHLGGTTGVAGAGSAVLPTFFPLVSAQGFDLYAQFRLLDSAAVQGVSLSNGVHFKVFP